MVDGTRWSVAGEQLAQLGSTIIPLPFYLTVHTTYYYLVCRVTLLASILKLSHSKAGLMLGAHE